MFKFPTIVPPVPSLPGLFTAVMQLKNAVEQLVSTSGRFNATHTFVQDAEPDSTKVGDLWVIPSRANKVYVWNGQVWVPLSADATP